MELNPCAPAYPGSSAAHMAYEAIIGAARLQFWKLEAFRSQATTNFSIATRMNNIAKDTLLFYLYRLINKSIILGKVDQILAQTHEYINTTPEVLP